MKDIVIIGSGGFAKEVAFLIEEINRVNNTWNLLGYINQNIGVKNGKYFTINNDDWLKSRKEKTYVAFGIGQPSLIKKIYKSLSQNKQLIFPNLIHPNATGDWERIALGEGNIICASNNFTTDIKVGNCNVFNLDCTVGHDSEIGNYNVINPSVNISGGVVVNESSLIGTGATILQYLSIASNSIIGAGAILTKDITESGIYIGSPAKILKKNRRLKNQ